MSNDMHCLRDDHELYREVLTARRAAHAKHGDNSIEVEPADSPRWLPILVEEIGEVANSLTYDGPSGNTRAELIDVLAVASAWVSALDHASQCRCTPLECLSGCGVCDRLGPEMHCPADVVDKD